MSPEDKTRLVLDIEVQFHSQLPERAFEHPIPNGIVGINLGGNIDILNQEVAIYTRSFPGDEVRSRLTATMSLDDAVSLADKLKIATDKAEDFQVDKVSYNDLRDYNPDNYPPARIIRSPDAEIGRVRLKDIEYPYPSGSNSQQFCIVITGLSADGKSRVPAVFLSRDDAEKLSNGIKKIKETMHSRGSGAIKIEEEFSPERVVYF